MTLCRVWMYGYPGFSGMGGMLFHTLFWIGIVLLFAAVVVYFLQKNKTTPTTLSHDMYMDELKQMFVRGEISDVEFMHRRDVLNGNVSVMHHQAKEANHEAVSEEKGEPHENV